MAVDSLTQNSGNNAAAATALNNTAASAIPTSQQNHSTVQWQATAAVANSAFQQTSDFAAEMLKLKGSSVNSMPQPYYFYPTLSSHSAPPNLSSHSPAAPNNYPTPTLMSHPPDWLSGNPYAIYSSGFVSSLPSPTVHAPSPSAAVSYPSSSSSSSTPVPPNPSDVIQQQASQSQSLMRIPSTPSMVSQPATASAAYVKREQDEKSSKYERHSSRDRSRSPHRRGHSDNSFRRDRDSTSDRIDKWLYSYNESMGGHLRPSAMCGLLYESIVLRLPSSFEKKVRDIAERIFNKIADLSSTELKQYISDTLFLDLRISGLASYVLKSYSATGLLLNFIKDLREVTPENASKLLLNFGKTFKGCVAENSKFGVVILRSATSIYDRLSLSDGKVFRREFKMSFGELVRDCHSRIRTVKEDIAASYIYNFAFLDFSDEGLLWKVACDKDSVLKIAFKDFQRHVNNQFYHLRALFNICSSYHKPFSPEMLVDALKIMSEQFCSLPKSDREELYDIYKSCLARMRTQVNTFPTHQRESGNKSLDRILTSW